MNFDGGWYDLRMMPNDLPPWYTVYQQTIRLLKAAVFENLVRDLRSHLAYYPNYWCRG